MKLQKHFLIGSILFFLIAYTYRDIWFIYFQQDEWYWFKKLILFDQSGIWGHIRLVSNHFVPLFSWQFDLMYRLFGTNQAYYGIYNFLFHFINVCLLYTFVLRYTKSKLNAFMSAALFATYNTPQQAVIWYGTSPMSLPSAALGILSLITTLRYIQSNSLKYMYYSILLIICGLLFYESLMALLIFIPLWIMIEKRNNLLKTFQAYFVSSAAYFFFRSRIQILDGITISTSYAEYIHRIIHNMLVFPLLGFSQLFVPSLGIYEFAQNLILNNPGLLLQFSSANRPLTDITVLTNIMWSALSILFMFIIILIVFTSFIKARSRKFIIIMTLFSIINLLPYALLPSSGLESRHFYFPAIGGAIITGTLLYSLYKRFTLNLNKLVVFAVLLFIVFSNASYTIKIIDDALPISYERKEFVIQLQKTYQVIPHRTVFFSENGNLPFQSGVGEMIMVLFSNKQPYHIYFESEFLTHMNSEGFLEKDGIGFGYFYSIDKLKKGIEDKQFTIDDIYAFSWDRNTLKLQDTTKSFRMSLRNGIVSM